ncbi:MAG: hypothetical protein ACLFPS_03015 [Clostridia bacterium]
MRNLNRKWAIISIVAGILATTALIATLCLYFKKNEDKELDERKYTEIEL